jgi:hypothetical protein
LISSENGHLSDFRLRGRENQTKRGNQEAEGRQEECVNVDGGEEEGDAERDEQEGQEGGEEEADAELDE